MIEGISVRSWVSNHWNWNPICTFSNRAAPFARINLREKVEEAVILQRVMILLDQIQSFPHRTTSPVLCLFLFHDPPSWRRNGRGTGHEIPCFSFPVSTQLSCKHNMAAEGKPTVLVTGEKCFILCSFRRS